MLKKWDRRRDAAVFAGFSHTPLGASPIFQRFVYRDGDLSPPRGVPARKKYVGTWIDSMFNHKWDYVGTVDDSGKKLTLEAEGPNYMAEGKTAKFRDSYEFKSPDHIEATSSMQGDDGKWVTFMTGQIKRKK